MASLNKVTLIGHLGADPEVRYTKEREAIATIRIATTETRKSKSGERKEFTEWHRVVFFNRLAEVVGEYLKKGSPIYVEGRIQTRKWQDKEGQDRYVVEIMANEMQMLGSRPSEKDTQQPGHRAVLRISFRFFPTGRSLSLVGSDLPFSSGGCLWNASFSSWPCWQGFMLFCHFFSLRSID